jgi:sugar phosphate permease
MKIPLRTLALSLYAFGVGFTCLLTWYAIATQSEHLLSLGILITIGFLIFSLLMLVHGASK